MSDDLRPRRILLVRHAKSSWDDQALADHDRPLAPRGRHALGPLRDRLERLGTRPELVLCSSSRRTCETLDGIRPVLGHDARIEIEAALYGADADRLLGRLRRVDDNEVTSAMLIGHNPGVADLTELLVGHADPAQREQVEKFPTAAVALLTFTGPWDALRQASATLESFWTPRSGTL